MGSNCIKCPILPASQIWKLHGKDYLFYCCLFLMRMNSKNINEEKRPVICYLECSMAFWASRHPSRSVYVVQVAFTTFSSQQNQNFWGYATWIALFIYFYKEIAVLVATFWFDSNVPEYYGSVEKWVCVGEEMNLKYIKIIFLNNAIHFNLSEMCFSVYALLWTFSCQKP